MKKKPIYDKRNRLNNLSGTDWIKLTKSYWISEKSAEDKIAFKHPAPFLIKDVTKLISFFTKKKQIVLDPFVGSGTTLQACCQLDRLGIGIDLNKNYLKIAKSRIKKHINFKNQKIIIGDSLKKIEEIKGEINYCVTSPPYHNILKNNGLGIRSSKDNYRQGARQGIDYYSEKKNDLGNQASYKSFLDLFGKIMSKVHKKLSTKAYTSIIISDFTVNKKETNVHGHIIEIMEKIGFIFVGTTILLQESKPLYPFGYPYSYVINHHHQNIINFRKNS
jgi:DNA modification methylase